MNKCAKKPCPECPFAGKTRGYLGPYESVDHLHQTLMASERFPCHKTMGDGADEEVQCIGAVRYMAKHAKMPRDPQIAVMVASVTKEEKDNTMWYPQLKEWHSKTKLEENEQ